MKNSIEASVFSLITTHVLETS